jgi:aminoglycoside phosphotransferase (APT) family kinase protein
VPPFASAFDAETLIDAAVAEQGPWDLSHVFWHGDGSDNAILETADGWMLRFPRDEESGAEFELALLARLRGRLPYRIPAIEWHGKHTRMAAYRKITGEAFDADDYEDATEVQREALASSMARFLAALHESLTPAEITELEVPEIDPQGELSALVREMSWLPAKQWRHAETLIGQFATMWVAGRPDEPKVLLHNDFQPGNMAFAEPVGELCGVWDFANAKVGPPAFDFRYFAGASGDLLERVAGHYQMLTTHPIDVRAAIVACRIEDLYDVLCTRDEDLFEAVVDRWAHAPI